jgi:UDP-glucose:(heptosyl)LPS alpha-1,3-glucosyltransferase
MKILLIFRIFNKHGGISRYVVELAERFVKEHETHLLTTKYDYKIANLIVHKKPIIEKPFWLQILSNTCYNTKYAKEIKEKFDIDIIHSNGVESLICDVLTMHSCHRAWVDYYKCWSLTKNIGAVLNPINRVVLQLEKKIVEKGDKTIISVSEGVKREILKYYNVSEEKIVVIPNGVDLEEFKPDQKKRRRIRDRLGIEENELILMFSGHEFERKGLRFIVEALPMVKDNIRLLVVGKDNPKPYMELAQKLGVLNKIIFAGFVSDISECYAASDIFVFPTAYEAFSLATLEAVASGLPILATKVNGTEELIIEGYNGFFIRRDPKDIAEKINILIEDDNLRRQMSKNARRTAENYSWDKIAKLTLEVYEEVIRR